MSPPRLIHSVPDAWARLRRTHLPPFIKTPGTLKSSHHSNAKRLRILATAFMHSSMASLTRGRLLNQFAAFGFSFVFVCVLTATSSSQGIKEFSSTTHLQKRSLEDVDLIEVCSSVQSFEQLETAINVDLQTVEIHPEAWVFATRCRVPGKACRGFSDDIESICRPKKSWLQLYGRTSGDTWRPHWVAVDTACVCSIRKKRRNLTSARMPLMGKTFIP